MAKRPIFLAIVAGATALILVPMTVFGLPYGRFDPESFTHQYTLPTNDNETHLHIDADATNGSRPCAPIDATANVIIGDTHTVGVCIETYEPNSIYSFELHVRYSGDPDATPPTNINVATEVADVAPALDDNPNANDGEGATMLGSGWDCTSFGILFPKGEDPSTPNVADAVIVCNADLVSPDLDLAADPGLLATIEFTAGMTPGDDLIDFGPIDQRNANKVFDPRPGGGAARCGTAQAADRVGCFGAVIHKTPPPPPFDCLWEDPTRGTHLGLQGDDWEFGYDTQVIQGTGRVLHFGTQAVVVGVPDHAVVVGFGTCPAGPGMGLAIDFSDVPNIQIYRLQDTTAGVALD
jgi:hypothetical protein